MSALKTPTDLATLLKRRHLLGAACAATLLAACGGGGAAGDDSGSGPPPAGGGGGGGGGTPPGQPPGAPAIDAFEADRTAAFVGERIRLTARFSGGSARIDPDLGPVTSGVPVTTPVLDRDRQWILVVAAPGRQDVERTLSVTVAYRDRYAALGARFAVSQHAAVSAGDGRVIVIGGSRDTGVLSDAIDAFDPRTNGMLPLGTLASGRALAQATRRADGRILVSGGVASRIDAPHAEWVDEHSGRATPAAPMSTWRVNHAAVLLADGRVLLTGGITTGEGHDLGISDSAEVWEPHTGHFRRLAAPMRIPRASHTMTLLPDGRVLIVGGYSSDVPYLLAEIFDPRREAFAPLPDTGGLRAEHAAHLAPDGRHVLVLGGETAEADGDDPLPLASALRYDVSSGLFAPLPPLAAPRTLARSVMLPSGQVLLFGGQEQAGRHSASAERYDPATGGRALAPLDGDRAYHSVNRLPDGRVLVVGGESRAGTYATAVLAYH